MVYILVFRTAEKMYCVTGEATPNIISNATKLSITIAGPDTTEVTYKTLPIFVYHDNPNITSVSRTGTFRR